MDINLLVVILAFQVVNDSHFEMTKVCKYVSYIIVSFKVWL